VGTDPRRVPALLTAIALAASACKSTAIEAAHGTLVFKGNHEYSDANLKTAARAEIERLNEHGFRKADVDDVAFVVERTYHVRGFAFARVDYEYSPERAVIRVDEGPLVALDRVRFRGNRALDDRQLEDYLNEKHAGYLGVGERIYVESDVDRLANAVESAYDERGFLDVRVSKPETKFSADRTTATVTIEVSEGPQYVLDRIDADDLPLLDRVEVQQRLASYLDGAYVPRVRVEVRNAIESLYGARGHPDASAQVEERMPPPVPNETRVSVALVVAAQPGPEVHVRNVVVRGTERTDPEFVRSRLLVKPGDLYDGDAIRRSYQRVFGTGVFDSVDLTLQPVDGDPQSRDLVVTVVEGSTLFYFGEIGLGSYDLLRGKIGARKKNLFGEGLVGRTELVGSIRGASLTFGVTDPWFLESDWTADLPVTFLDRTEPAFTIREADAGLRVTRPFGDRFVGGGAYRLRFSRIGSIDVVDEANEDRRLRVGAVGPLLEYDSRNDFFEPTTGNRSRAFGELALPAFGGEISFVHGGLFTSQFVQLFEGTVIAGAAQTEWIVPIGATSGIPIQERLFLGGENDVRSFGQWEVGPKDRDGDPLGGEVKNFVSTELRQHLLDQLSGALFADYGNVSETTDDALRDFRPAVGFGLRYGLPIGPLRVDFAFNPDHHGDEDAFRIQFAVGLPY
jgi:outer membrane protein insertion porin family